MTSLPPRLKIANDHIDAGRLEQARAALQRALQSDPDDTDANSMMCWVLRRLGEHDRAMFFAGRALRRFPDDPNLLVNLGNLQLQKGRADDAIATYHRAAAAAPDHAECVVGLSNALALAHRHDESLAVCREGLERHPDYPKFLSNSAAALLQMGRAREAVATLRRAASLHPDDPRIATGMANAVNYAGDEEPDTILAAHAAYGALVERLLGPTPQPPPLSGRTRPRIGFLSGDLRTHSVGYFAEPILEHLDRGAFETIVYSTAGNEDAMSARMRGHVSLWRNVVVAEIDELARLIRADGVDILIELAGHTLGNRLLVLHRRPAPIQMTAIGYPNTTGLSAADYRMGDPVILPDDPDRFERVVRVGPSCVCYRPPGDAPPPECAPGPFTFGSFNTLAKLDDLTVSLWARTMAKVPDSRLLLKASALRSEAVRRDVSGRFERAGVAPDRLDLLGWSPGTAEHLSLYNRVDVALDTFPYHGTTTTCEALFMGVPVVTLMGRTAAARVGGSILRGAGFPELVADDPEAFVRAAGDLAARGRRDDLNRRRLRDALLASTICDGPGFARRLGAALTSLVRAAQ